MRLYLVDERASFIRSHVLDLIVIAIPFLRPFRLLRLLAILISTTRRAGGLAVRRVTLYVIGTSVILASVGAVLVYDAEKSVPVEERTIKTLGDAFWWALITVTTIGYGDVFPRSATGRMFAAVLMVMGIALIGTLTAALASWFVSLVRGPETAKEKQQYDDRYDTLLFEIQKLSSALAALQSPPANPPGDRGLTPPRASNAVVLNTSEIVLAKPIEASDHLEQLNREALFHAGGVGHNSDSDSA
jgi:voltage-gated potassium channel